MSILFVIGMEDTRNENQVTQQVIQQINTITFEKRSVLRFLAFGWIIIGFFGLVVIGNPPMLFVYLLIALVDRVYYHIKKKELAILANFASFLSRVCFGAKHEQEGNIRVWWTFTVGFLLLDLLIVIFVLTSWLVVPIILLIVHRESVLKGLYTIIFLPRNSKMVSPHHEERKRKQALKDDELLSDWQETYMYQLGPDKTSQTVAVSTFIIAGGIVFAFISFIPNLILSSFRKFRLSRIMSEKMTPRVARFFQSDFFRMLGGIPFLNFSGDWYIEENSRVMNYSGANGFVSAFSGKWSDIIIYPLAVSSIALQFYARNEDFSDFDEVVQFILSTSILIAIISALVFHLVFPVLWTLDDASILNVSFSKGYYGSKERKHEIAQVTDIGQRIRQFISVILGASTILNLSLFFGSIEGRDTNFDIFGYDIDKIFYRYYYLLGVVIIMWICVVPGIMLSAYIYLTQDHIKNVNELRYNSSKSPWIAVGTLDIDYSFDKVLPILESSQEEIQSEIWNDYDDSSTETTDIEEESNDLHDD